MGIFFKHNDTLAIEFSDEAATATKRLGVITGRTPVEVVSDAMRTYAWVLEQQAAGHKVGLLDNGTDIVDLVRNRSAAQE